MVFRDLAPVGLLNRFGRSAGGNAKQRIIIEVLEIVQAVLLAWFAHGTVG
jgi:hypothetical protein